MRAYEIVSMAWFSLWLLTVLLFWTLGVACYALPALSRLRPDRVPLWRRARVAITLRRARRSYRASVRGRDNSGTFLP